MCLYNYCVYGTARTMPPVTQVVGQYKMMESRMKLKLKSLFGLIMAVSLIQNSFFCYAEEDIKLSAPLFTNSAGITGKKAAETVFKIIVPKKNTMGTGFLHKSGSIITAAHVVSGCEPKDIFILLPQGDKVKITKISSDGCFDMYRVNDANDDGDHTRALITHHLPRAAALIKHQNGIPDASMGIIERDKIPAVIIFDKTKRLYNEQPPMFVIRVADGGDNSTNNFSNDHDLM